jgi:hypothetical protein
MYLASLDGHVLEDEGQLELIQEKETAPFISV